MQKVSMLVKLKEGDALEDGGNTEMNPKGIGWEGMDWVVMSQDGEK
jgi:hypothetical protein